MKKLISDYFSQIFSVKIPQKQAMQEIHTKITSTLNKAYQEPEMKKIIKSQSVESLLSKSVQYFVGSRSTPRNQFLMKILMQQARVNAEAQNNQRLIKLVKYYYAYYVKLGAIKDGNQKQYQISSDMFMQLAELGDNLSNYLVGKQIYKMVESGQMSSWKDKEVMNQAKKVFINSICSQQFGALYYIADIDEKHRQQNQITQDSQRMIFELYTQAASLGFPLAYFKTALLYKKKGDYNLYKKYLILASQSGIIQAQHNLGLQYVKGQFFPKNQINGMAWFIQAGANGFVYSKYNLSKILGQGTSCGRLKPNKKASLIYLQQISRSGQLDVTKEIQQIVSAIK